MARSYAPIYTSIWHDPEFVALSSRAQRAYFLALSQPEISYCGVVGYTTRRWARMAGDTKPRDVERAVAELEAAGFVLLDAETEELWVRSFVKHNGVLKQPQLRTAMRREYDDIHSATIRRLFFLSLPAKEREGLQAPCPQPDGTLPAACASTRGIGMEGVVEEPEPEPSTSNQEPEPSSSSRSDSRGPQPLDDDDAGLRREAQARLDRRVAEKGPVGDPDAWLATCIGRLSTERSVSRAQRARIDHCADCAGQGVVELADGTYRQCFHDRVSA